MSDEETASEMARLGILGQGTTEIRRKAAEFLASAREKGRRAGLEEAVRIVSDSDVIQRTFAGTVFDDGHATLREVADRIDAAISLPGTR